MSVDLNIKIDHIVAIAKPYQVKQDTRVLLLADSDGWSDGYIADLTSHNVDKIKAQALLKGTTTNFDSDNKPKIKSIIPGKGHEVEDIEWDLDDNNIILKNKKISAKINPSFLKYFVQAYKDIYINPGLEVVAKDKPVRVLCGNDVIGLIMPIWEAV